MTVAGYWKKTWWRGKLQPQFHAAGRRLSTASSVPLHMSKLTYNFSNESQLYLTCCNVVSSWRRAAYYKLLYAINCKYFLANEGIVDHSQTFSSRNDSCYTVRLTTDWDCQCSTYPSGHIPLISPKWRCSTQPFPDHNYDTSWAVSSTATQKQGICGLLLYHF